jgi:hypothetical protein
VVDRALAVPTPWDHRQRAGLLQVPA